MSAGWIVGLAILGAIALVTVMVNVVVRRKGYSIPGKTVVRCSRGHLFVTTWVEGGSLNAVRLTPYSRIQRCPVGHHWSKVHPVKEVDLTDDERTEFQSELH